MAKKAAARRPNASGDEDNSMAIDKVLNRINVAIAVFALIWSIASGIMYFVFDNYLKQITEHGKALEVLKGMPGSIEKLAERIETRQEKLSNELSSLDRKMIVFESANADIREIKSETKALGKQISDSSVVASSLSGQIKTVSDKLVDASETFEKTAEQQKKIAEVVSKIDAIEKAVATTEKSISAINSATTSQQARLEKIEATVTSIDQLTAVTKVSQHRVLIRKFASTFEQEKLTGLVYETPLYLFDDHQSVVDVRIVAIEFVAKDADDKLSETLAVTCDVEQSEKLVLRILTPHPKEITSYAESRGLDFRVSVQYKISAK